MQFFSLLLDMTKIANTWGNADVKNSKGVSLDLHIF